VVFNEKGVLSAGHALVTFGPPSDFWAI